MMLAHHQHLHHDPTSHHVMSTVWIPKGQRISKALLPRRRQHIHPRCGPKPWMRVAVFVWRNGHPKWMMLGYQKQTKTYYVNSQYKTFHMLHHVMNHPCLYHDVSPLSDFLSIMAPRDRTRLQAPRSPKLRQSIFNGEDGRLGVLCPHPTPEKTKF